MPKNYLFKGVMLVRHVMRLDLRICPTLRDCLRSGLGCLRQLSRNRRVETNFP